MPKYDLGCPAERFINAVAEFTGEYWSSVAARAREAGPAGGTMMDVIEDKLSAVERSAFERRIRTRAGKQLNASFDALTYREISRTRNAYETAVFALQNRDKLPSEVVRSWLRQFEHLGTNVDELLTEDEASV